MIKERTYILISNFEYIFCKSMVKVRKFVFIYKKLLNPNIKINFME